MVLLAVVVIGGVYYYLYGQPKQPAANTQNQAAQTATTENQNTGLANPASVNCADKGGTLVIEKRGDGGEYGICFFEDNRQCEEWALFRGECPAGGRKITGYENQEQIYCAITGGEVDMAKGVCVKDNQSCEFTKYYNGTCQ